MKDLGFNIRAAAGAIVLEVYNEIFYWQMLDDYLRYMIDEYGDDAPMIIRINSIGGDPRTGLSLYGIISKHKGSTTGYIEHMCDSSATMPACACDVVVANDFPFEYLIHDPTIDQGWVTVEEARFGANYLEKIRDDFVQAYVNKTGQPEELIREWMKNQKIMNAQEALELGFVDKIQPVENTLDQKMDYAMAAKRFDRPKEFQLEGRGKSPATPKPQQTTGSNMSDSKSWLEKLRASFGLGDTADEADVVLSAKALKADLKAEKDKVTQLEDDLKSKDDEIKKLQDDLEDLKGKLPTEEEEEQEAERQVEAELEAAVKSFKITASNKEKMAAEFKGNPEGLKKALSFIPEGAAKNGKGVKKPSTKAKALVGGLNDQVKKDLGVE